MPSISAAEKLTLVSGNKFQPWSDSNLPNGGIVTEIVEAAFTKAGIETNILRLPWKRGYNSVVNGSVFATFPYSYSKKRASEVYFSIPLIISGLTTFVHKDSSIPYEYKNFDVFKGMTFCTALGYEFATNMQPMVESGKIKLYRIADMEACFEFLRVKRGDALIINKHVGWNMVKSLFKPPYPIRALKEHELSVYHLAVTRKHPDALKILSKFNEMIETMEKEGTIEEIIHRQLNY